MNARVIWEHELSKEQWMIAANRIKEVAPVIAKILERINAGGRGQEDAKMFVADMQLAHMAMYHVAEHARDKCRIIPVP